MREKTKLKIDLIRDSLKNIFIVMFAIISGEISIVYKILHNDYNFWDLVILLVGIVIIGILIKVKENQKLQIKELLEGLDE
jgi:hypothetical protein